MRARLTVGSAYEPELPLLPYAGTSGWSGSDTSRERAEQADDDGTTTQRQRQALATLRVAGDYGATWKELATVQGWHHGTASGVLSVLHKEGRVVRLKDRRHRCAVYVLAGLEGDRETAAHGRRKPAGFTLAASEAEALRRLRIDLDLRSPDHGTGLFRLAEVRQVVAALERAARHG
jgi:DNA-binding MarR family transcriptional regulator